MLELISLSIFLLSSAVLLAMIFMKIPALVKMPDVSSKKGFDLNGKMKRVPVVGKVSPDKVFQQTVSKMKVLSKETGTKTVDWVKNFKNGEQKNKFGKSENYWKEVRKSSKKH